MLLFSEESGYFWIVIPKLSEITLLIAGRATKKAARKPGQLFKIFKRRKP